MFPERTTPCPPNPAILISFRSMLITDYFILFFGTRLCLGSNQFQLVVQCGALYLHELAYYDRPVHINGGFFGVCPVTDNAFFLVVVQIIQPLRLLVHPPVYRGAGSDDLNKAEARPVHRLNNRLLQLADM